MKTLRKNALKKTKTLRKKITNYFCDTKEQDICCEDYYNREEIVEEIITIYKKRFLHEYLEWFDNEIVAFVGPRSHLEEEKNIKGVKLWDLIASKNKNKNKKLSETNIRKLLMDLPLYYLLAFLGHSYLKFRNLN